MPTRQGSATLRVPERACAESAGARCSMVKGPAAWSKAQQARPRPVAAATPPAAAAMKPLAAQLASSHMNPPAPFTVSICQPRHGSYVTASEEEATGRAAAHVDAGAGGAASSPQLGAVDQVSGTLLPCLGTYRPI